MEVELLQSHSQFRNQRHKNDTALLWQLKKSTKEILNLTWSVLKMGGGYLNISMLCLLCLNEKSLIATYPDQKQLLNKWSELIAKCWHKNKFLLINYKANNLFKRLFLKSVSYILAYIQIFSRENYFYRKIVFIYLTIVWKVVNCSSCYF